jgi:outer membrane lipoprotein-sorting protein
VIAPDMCSPIKCGFAEGSAGNSGDKGWTMKSSYLFRACALFLLFLSLSGLAQQPAKAASSADLERTLDRIDAAAANFHATEASFVWDQYNSVVNEVVDTQKGKIYFRRVGNETQMSADISEPDKKYILFVSGKIQYYQPKIEQVNEYTASSDNKEAIESFLVLGFGGSGHGLAKSFEVTYVGHEKPDGVETDKLELVPKSPKVRNMFDHIFLWIDPHGVSVRQQLVQPSGDYRLAKYSDIQLKDKIPDTVFKLKTTSKTQFVPH